MATKMASSILKCHVFGLKTQSLLQTENARIETCVPIIGQTFPSLLVHQMILSMALFQV